MLRLGLCFGIQKQEPLVLLSIYRIMAEEIGEWSLLRRYNQVRTLRMVDIRSFG